MTEIIVDQLVKHQKECGPFYEIGEGNDSTIECEKCGLKIERGPDSPLIETEEYRLEFF